jgi:hypothetical protein
MRGVSRNALFHTAVAILAAAAVAGCGEDGSSSDRESRSADAVNECRGHGGVTAFDDDVVICADQTSNEARGERAVEACRGREGVRAFDDDIVICGDESFHEAPED